MIVNHVFCGASQDFTIGRVYPVDFSRKFPGSVRLGVVVDDDDDERVFFAEEFTAVNPEPAPEPVRRAWARFPSLQAKLGA